MKANTISVAEASRMLGVRLDYIYRLLWDGTLAGEKTDGVWKIRHASVQAYLKKRGARVREAAPSKSDFMRRRREEREKAIPLT